MAGRRSAGRRPAPAVSRTASHPPALPVGQAQEIPNAQARAEIPCRAGPQAQHSASHPPTERPAIRQPYRPAGRRPQEIPNARARGDTTTRRPARNSKRARARYWRRGGRPLRVRKPKIFLGKGSKNRFRGAGAGKVGGVKNATEEENGAVWAKKEAAYAAADGEIGGRRVSFSWHHENGQRESGTALPRREIEKRNCLQSVGSSAIILSVPDRR